MSRRAELVGAFMLLTRLPVAGLSAAPTPAAACVWAYPLVGAVVGALAAGVFAAAAGVGLPPMVAAILAVGAMVLATGALHEDGLADTADGFGGGRMAAGKLEIMRDSRIGSYGALALMLSLALRVAALAALADPRRVAVALIVAGALGRGAMLVAVWRLAPARETGLAAALGPAPRLNLTIGLATVSGLAILAPAALAAAVLAAGGMTALMQRQVGGYTGDTLGATEQVAECAALLAMLIV